MIDLFVYRGLGERDGGEIFDPLLSDVAPALQRGKFEIDFNTPKIDHSLEVEYTPALRPGDEVSVRNSRTNEVIFGVVKEFSHVRNGVSVYTTLSIEVAQ